MMKKEMRLGKLIRVFPRKTNATPDDDMARFREPTMFDQADEVHVSVTFTYDMRRAEYLAEQWEDIAPVKLGGPATGKKSNDFVAGKYLKRGYTITSRGCPNKCWFCSVWRREGDIRELPIVDGYNVLDDNLLACSNSHIIKVFEMLKKQNRPIEFTGGLEAKRLRVWHIDELLKLNLKQAFFAYDTEDDYEPLLEVSKKLKKANLMVGHKMRCFVLIGYPWDNISLAKSRLIQTIKLGFMPMAMLYRNEKGEYSKEWKRFQREWANPTILGAKYKKYFD